MPSQTWGTRRGSGSWETEGAMTAPQQLTAGSLSGFDWFLVGVVGVSALMAFQRGLVRVLFSLGGVLLGTLIASWDYVRLATWLHRWITSVTAAQATAFVVILAGVMIVSGILASFVIKAVRAVGFGFLDRLLGACVGAVRGMLLGVAVMMGLAAFAPGSDALKNSLLAPYFLAGVHAVSFVVPQRFEAQLSEGARHLREKTPEVLKRSARSQ
jgi:membrane protein required for colicin V production